MKQEPSGLSAELLARCLLSEYGVETGSIVFLPKGEESYNFIVESVAEKRFLVRLQGLAHGRNLERSLSIAATLRDRGGLRSIVAAQPNRHGRSTTVIEAYRAALFPYVEGETAYVQTPSDAFFARLGTVLDEIHAAAGVVRALHPLRETYSNPFRGPILEALEWARGSALPTGPRQHDVRRLLLSEAIDLTEFMDGFENLGHRVRSLDREFVITHGDPNLDNVIVSPDGDLHLVDWGEVALGPRERDLASYASDRLDLVLSAYQDAAGRPSLHADLFRFYRHRWCLQEIADYTTRIIFTNADPFGDGHAWAELQPYLPIRHDALAAGHQRTAALLSAMETE